MAIIRHTIPVTTNAASNLLTEIKTKQFYKYNKNICLQYNNNNNNNNNNDSSFELLQSRTK